MKKQNLEQRLKSAYQAVTPDVFDEILLRAKNENRDVIPKEYTVKPRKARVLKIALAAAVALLLLAGAVLGGTALYKAAKSPTNTEPPIIGESVPTTDSTPADTTETTVVNPPVLEKYYVGIVRTPVNAAAPDAERFLGVYMTVDVNNKKVTISATVNRTGGSAPKKLLNSQRYGDEGYAPAIKALLIAAAEEGYFSDERNLISVSVDPSEFEKVSEALGAAYAELIERGLLTTDSRLTGKVDPQQMLYLAETYDISWGHAKYALLLAEKAPEYSLDELIRTDADKVIALCDKNGIDTKNTRFGEGEAMNAVCRELGITREDMAVYDAGVIKKNDCMYLVVLDFSANGTYYHRLFDAQSAALIFSHSFAMVTDEEAIAFAIENWGSTPVPTDSVVKTLIDYHPQQFVESGIAKLSCTVTLRCEDGKERFVVFDVETMKRTGRGEQEETIRWREVEEIVGRDLGTKLGEDSVAGAYHINSPDLWVAWTTLGNERHAYLIHYHTGDILYKESYKVSDAVSGYFTESFAKKAAQLTAELSGAKEVKLLDCKASAPYIRVTLLDDGIERVCTLDVRSGSIDYH